MHAWLGLILLTQSPVLKAGDRVVFLGDALIERSARYGYVETVLTSRLPGLGLTFRNLGWSGDSVFAHSRSYFGPAEEGYRRLVDQIELTKPTVTLCSYGSMEAFEGDAGLAPFLDGYRKLIRMLKEKGSRVVLLGPPPHESAPAPLPPPDAHNRQLVKYAAAIGQLAKEEECGFIDLYALLSDPKTPRPLTDNGIHLTAQGYWHLAQVLANALQAPLAVTAVKVDGKTAAVEAQHGQAKLAEKTGDLATPGQRIVIELNAAQLPAPAPPTVTAIPARTLSVAGLPAGNYQILVDQQPVATASASDLAAGIAIQSPTEAAQVEKLRQTILKKEELFFHRWRPQNETYLFGFRKHEQGNNAVEIPQFDPLVAAQDKQADELRQPKPQRWEIVRQSSPAKP